MGEGGGMRITSFQIIIAMFWIWIVGVILTFGHTFNSEALKKSCYSEYYKGPDVACMVTTAMLSSMFWPLYWSAQLQKKD